MNACFPKFLEASKAGHWVFGYWLKFGNWQKISKFFKLGVALVLHILLRDFSLKQTKNSCSVTAALEKKKKEPTTI